MIVLGVTDGITCGSAIARDGVIVAAVNEERLSRLKMAYGFPRASIAEAMALAGVSPQDIDLVAAATANNYFFDGQIDEVAVYNTALSATEVQAHFNAASGNYASAVLNDNPVGHWRLGDPPEIADSSGSASSGTSTAGCSATGSGATGWGP